MLNFRICCIFSCQVFVVFSSFSIMFSSFISFVAQNVSQPLIFPSCSKFSPLPNHIFGKNIWNMKENEGLTSVSHFFHPMEHHRKTMVNHRKYPSFSSSHSHACKTTSGTTSKNHGKNPTFLKIRETNLENEGTWLTFPIFTMENHRNTHHSAVPNPIFFPFLGENPWEARRSKPRSRRRPPLGVPPWRRSHAGPAPRRSTRRRPGWPAETARNTSDGKIWWEFQGGSMIFLGYFDGSSMVFRWFSLNFDDFPRCISRLWCINLNDYNGIYIYTHIIREALGKFEWWKQNIYILSHGVFLYVFLQKMRSSYQQQQYAFFLLGVHCQVAKIPANRAWEAPKVCWDRPLQRFSCECHWHGPSVSGMSPWVFWNDQGKRGRRGEVWKNRWYVAGIKWNHNHQQPSVNNVFECFWYVLSVWCLHDVFTCGSWRWSRKATTWSKNTFRGMLTGCSIEAWSVLRSNRLAPFPSLLDIQATVNELTATTKELPLANAQTVHWGWEWIIHLIIWKNVCCQKKGKNNRNHQLSRV